MLFHDQPAVRNLAAAAQDRLNGIPGLDMVEMRWLHLTTLIVGFADEVPHGSTEAMAADARQRLSSLAPVPVTLGRILYHPQAVTLAVEPSGALTPVLDAVRDATRAGGCNGHLDQDPWIPHISIAYSHGPGPAAPIIAALGRRLPPAEIAVKSISLVAQTQIGRSWQWRPLTEIPFGASNG
jgi:2'-5' RNA ligase